VANRLPASYRRRVRASPSPVSASPSSSSPCTKDRPHLFLLPIASGLIRAPKRSISHYESSHRNPVTYRVRPGPKLG
jgi:hypothetical protein